MRTSDISPRVQGNIQTTRPTFIKDLYETRLLSTSTPGQQIKKLTEESARAFLYEVERSDRKNPLVIVSPMRDGGYLVDSEYLRSMLVGLADVVQIPEKENTYEIANILGSRFSAWGGAANIVYTSSKDRSSLFVPNTLILADEIHNLQNSGLKVENEILTRIAHRTNLPFSWHHISPSVVREKQIQDELLRRKIEATQTGETHEYISLLEEINKEQVATIINLEQTKKDIEMSLLDKEEELSKTQFEINGLKSNLNKRASRKVDEARVSDKERNGILAIINNSATPEDCLNCISMFYGDRVVILPSAWESVIDSRNFKHGKQLFVLLVKLADEYWESLEQGGVGDSEARKIFTKHYAAHESDTVKNSKDLSRYRTFQYKGIDVLMLSHLKIGTSNNIEETIRIHFHWDSVDRVIAVGYCGKHLPLK